MFRQVSLISAARHFPMDITRVIDMCFVKKAPHLMVRGFFVCGFGVYYEILLIVRRCLIFVAFLLAIFFALVLAFIAALSVTGFLAFLFTFVGT